MTVSAGGSRPASASFTPSAKSFAFQIDSADDDAVRGRVVELVDLHRRLDDRPLVLGARLGAGLLERRSCRRPWPTTSSARRRRAVNVVMLLSRQSAGALVEQVARDAARLPDLVLARRGGPSCPGRSTLPTMRSASTLPPFALTTTWMPLLSSTSNSACFAFCSVTRSETSIFPSASKAALAIGSSAA